jgi:hypothetical protein
VESGVEKANGLADGGADDPVVAVAESARGAAPLLEVLKLNGLASGFGVRFLKGFAEGAEDPKENVGLGVSVCVVLLAAEISKMFGVWPSGMGDGVGVWSGAKAPNVVVGFLGEGGTAGGVAEGVISAGSEKPKVGLLDGRLSPKGEGFDAGAEDAAG